MHRGVATACGQTGLVALALLALTTFAAAQAPAPPAARTLAQARAHFERGTQAYTAGQLDVARVAFEQAYALLPTPELSFNLGRVHERLGRSVNAIEHYRRYLTEAGPRAHDRREVEKRLSVLEAARDELRVSLKQIPPTASELQAEARRFFKRGTRLYARGRYRGALAAFAAAHSMSHVPELYFNLGLTSWRLGARRDAIDYFRAYLDALPRAPDREAVEAEILRLRRAR